MRLLGGRAAPPGAARGIAAPRLPSCISCVAARLERLGARRRRSSRVRAGRRRWRCVAGRRRRGAWRRVDGRRRRPSPRGRGARPRSASALSGSAPAGARWRPANVAAVAPWRRRPPSAGAASAASGDDRRDGDRGRRSAGRSRPGARPARERRARERWSEDRPRDSGPAARSGGGCAPARRRARRRTRRRVGQRSSGRLAIPARARGSSAGGGSVGLSWLAAAARPRCAGAAWAAKCSAAERALGRRAARRRRPRARSGRWPRSPARPSACSGDDVGGRAEHLPRVADRVLAAPAGRSRSRRRGASLAVEQQVGGLDVAVDHPAAVGVVERRGGLAGSSSAPRSRVTAPARSASATVPPARYSITMNGRPAGASLDRRLADVVDRDDVRVARQPRGGPRLALEPRARRTRRAQTARRAA